jgi:2-desacetyl-2-hydroxyethyl bacteriochlorophyllide A dehydrogenase
LTTVRQLVFHGPRKLSVEEAELPIPGSGEVRVAVHSVGVCGSDVHGYAGVNARRTPGMVMGHEAVGTIEALGEGVDGFLPGDPVAVNPIVSCGECEQCRAGLENVCAGRRLYGCIADLPGAYADSFVVRAANCVFFHGPVPLEWGALVEPLAVGARGALQGGVGPGDEVLVVGGGPIGIGAALGARRRGADRVVVSEPLEHRRALAERLGFETVDPIAEEIPQDAFPVAIECVGHSATLAAALRAVRIRGTVVFVGLAEETIELPATPLMVGERVIVGSAAYTSTDFRDTAEWVASGQTDLSPVIESRVDLDALPDAFEGYAGGSIDALKTVLQHEGV